MGKKLLLFLILPIFLIAASFLIYRFYFRQAPHSPSNPILLLETELSSFSGENGSPIYISLLGHIFDVSSGRSHYGPGGSYHFFTGKDGTRAFVTGQFNAENLIPRISDLSNDKMADLNNWLVFYRGKYPEIGKSIGHFFNEKGEPTDHYREYELKLKGSSLEKEREKEFQAKYPRCNSKWHIDHGGEVWCDANTAKLGGIERDWIGVPRKYYKKPGARAYECICVKTEEALSNPDMFKPYDNCPGEDHNCKY